MKNKTQNTNAKTADEAINLMHEIAKTHGIKFVAVTPDEFEDCDSFTLLTPAEQDRVIESVIEEIGEGAGYALDNGFELARRIAKK